LAAALTQQLASAWDARGGYCGMSRGALIRVHERFDRDVARHRLEALYDCMRPAAAAR
jgi:hypothetical protein